MRWWDGRAEGGTSLTAGGTIEQGSPQADAFVKRLFEVGSDRLVLNTIVLATPSQADGNAINGLKLFYNCDDGAGEPGADRCSVAELWWWTNPLPSQVRDPSGWHLVGTYSIALDKSKGQVYKAEKVAFAFRSIG